MVRTPAKPGLPEREQHKAGRAELCSPPRSRPSRRKSESNSASVLSPGGFNPARDIAGIAVNRWPHGYAPEYNALSDGGTNANTPNFAASKQFGRIAIAYSDAGRAAYPDIAIDQARIKRGEVSFWPGNPNGIVRMRVQ